MKRLAIIVLIALASVALATDFVPRHVDPSQVPEERPLPNLLLLLYASALENIASLDLEKAREALEKLGTAYIPSNLRYVFQRFNELLNQLVDNINKTDTLLSEARRALSIGDRRSALIYARNASKSLLTAYTILYQLIDATDDMRRLGIPTSVLRHRLDECRTTLNDMYREINELLRLLTITKTVETTLEIDVHPRKILFGDYVDIHGCLETRNGTPLPSRIVVVHVGSLTRYVRTNRTGCFEYSERIEFYQRKLPIYAEYIPRGSDEDVYGYSRSKTIVVDVQFVTPFLEISVSKHVALPLDRIELKIRTLPNLTLSIYVPFNDSIATLSSGSGQVSAFITIPPNVVEGKYTLYVRVEPRGIIGPNEKSVTIEVRRNPPSIRIDTPSFVFTGMPLRIRIETNVSSSITVRIPKLGIEHHELNATYIELYVSIPLEFIDNSLNLYIEIQPQSPRYEAVTMSRAITVYSTPCIASTFIILASVAVISIARKTRIGRGEALSAPSMGMELSPSIPRLEISDPITSLFLRLLNALARIVGRPIGRSETLREYLEKVRSRAPGLAHELRGIFSAMERYLYDDPVKLDIAFRRRIIEMLRKMITRLRV